MKFSQIQISGQVSQTNGIDNMNSQSNMIKLVIMIIYYPIQSIISTKTQFLTITRETEKLSQKTINLVCFNKNCVFNNKEKKHCDRKFQTLLKCHQSGAVGGGVVSWTCDPVLALGQRYNSHSLRLFCCNPLG